MPNNKTYKQFNNSGLVFLPLLILIAFLLFVPIPNYQSENNICKTGESCPEKGWSLGDPLWKKIYKLTIKRTTNSSPQEESETLTPTPTTENSISSNWKIYRNEEFGFEFSYPESISIDYEGWRGQSNNPKGFWEVALSDSQKLINISVLIDSTPTSGEGGEHPIYKAEDSFLGPTEPVNFMNKDAVQLIITDTRKYKVFIKKIAFMENDTLWKVDLNVDKNIDSSEEVGNQILSTFKFLPDTTNWQTYTNEEYGFEIKYPKDWVYELNTFQNNETAIFFGTRESKAGGYIWGVTIYKNSSLENLIQEQGQQFADRKEEMENITVGDYPATLVTVTTTKYKDWISKRVYIINNNQIYVIGNGAVNDLQFNGFYNSFKFTI